MIDNKNMIEHISRLQVKYKSNELLHVMDIPSQVEERVGGLVL